MAQPEYRSSPEPEHQTPWRLITFGVIAALTVIFILQNRKVTTIYFLLFDVRARVWTSLVVAVALGVILDRLFISWWKRRRADKQRT